MSFIKRAFQFSSIILFLAILAFSLFKYFKTNEKSRYIMYFQSHDYKELCCETRFLSRNSPQGKIRLFADELLLGPVINRNKALFSKETKTEFCFQRGKILYVGLSKEALSFSAETSEIKKGIEIFKKNILKNFKELDAVVMYIDGVEV